MVYFKAAAVALLAAGATTAYVQKKDFPRNYQMVLCFYS